MAIEKTIDINVNAQDAITDLNLLNSILEEQEQITIELQREQQKLEQQLRDTPKNSLAAQKKLGDQLNHVKNSIKDQTLSVKQLKLQQTQLSKGTSDLTEDLVSNGGAMGLLNELTGGLAQKFKDSFEAISLSSKGLSGFKRAMLATGIGALVVGVGLLVANFDKVKDFLMGVSADTRAAREEIQKEMELLNNTIAKQSLELEVLSRGYKNGTLQGKQLEKAVKDVNDKFQDANLELDENNQLTDESLAFIDSQIDAIKAQARNKAILTKIEELYGKELANSSKLIAENSKLASEQANQTKLQAQLEAETNLGKREKLFKSIKASERRQKDLSDSIRGLSREKSSIEGEIDELVGQIETVDRPKSTRKKTTGGSGKSKEDIEKEEAIKLAELKEKIRDAEANKEDEARALELIKIKEQNEKLLKEAEDKNLKTEQLETSLNERLEAKQKEFDEIDKKREEAKEAKENAKTLKKQNKLIEELTLNKEFEELSFDEQRELINKREAILLEDKVLSDKQKLKLEKQFKKAKDEIDQAEFRAKQQTLAKTGQALDQLGAIAGEQTAAGKGLAIASATINTFRGVSDALAAKTATPFETALKFVNAASILSSGLQNVKKIVSVQIPKVKGANTSVSTGGGGGDASISQPPSFNIVGASDTNQLAEAIGEQTQQPVQAFVVANDVTTAQSLENNIVEGATLG